MKYSEHIKRVGEQLASLRKAAGLTQRELAEKCGVNYASIAKIESGTYNCSIVVLEKIAKCLNSSIELKANPVGGGKLFTVAWRGNNAHRETLTVGSDRAEFNNLEDAIAFAKAELENNMGITPVSEFEKAINDSGSLYGLSEADFANLGDNLEVYEHIFDEDGEEIDLVTRWVSDNYIVREYDADFYDSVIK